ncbi:hypothetical protein D3C85_1841890 [compost metagenome]
MDQRPELKHVIGMQMGDENNIQHLEIDAGIGEAAGNTEAAVDDDGAATDLKQ